MSKVINVRKAELKKLGFNDLVDWLSKSNDHVYIGRNMSHYVKGALGSKWANPFKIDKNGRDECLQKYEDHILNTPELKNSLHELKGKVLGCWCFPEKCHGDVLIKLVNHQD